MMDRGRELERIPEPTLTSSSVEMVCRMLFMRDTKVLVMGLLWSAVVSSTNSITPIRAGIFPIISHFDLPLRKNLFQRLSFLFFFLLALLSMPKHSPIELIFLSIILMAFQCCFTSSSFVCFSATKSSRLAHETFSLDFLISFSSRLFSQFLRREPNSTDLWASYELRDSYSIGW